MSSPPKWYTVIAVVALVWNVLGCFAVLADLMIRPEDLARLTAEQQAIHAARTWWSTTASLLAVFGGTLGSLGLILRKTWAMPSLAASVVGLVVQDIGLFIVAKGISLAGPVAIVLQMFVFFIALGLVWLARTATHRGWIPKQEAQSGG